MSNTPLHVAVTGGAGQIAYSLVFRIAAGEMFGKDQPVVLHMLELPQALNALEGVKMELQDCAFPLLKDVVIGSDPNIVFKDIDWALLVGATPRGLGMERGDLLAENAKIFIEQGQALDKVAKPTVQVVVVGNPCNTNCLIALKQAKRIPASNFHAMTRLDQNRAVGFVALKSGNSVSDIENIVIWGNHSATQVPDVYNATIKGENAAKVISDETWLQSEFLTLVQKRGAAIINARGKSSAASAANAIIDHVKSLLKPTPEGQWYSMAVYSKNNPYKIDQDLIFSFPCRTVSSGKYEIVPDLSWNEFISKKVRETESELLEERSMSSLTKVRG